MADDFMTVEEARRYLKASKMTIARLIRENVLETIPNPLDHRVKLVKRQDVEKIKKTYPVKPDSK